MAWARVSVSVVTAVVVAGVVVAAGGFVDAVEVAELRGEVPEEDALVERPPQALP